MRNVIDFCINIYVDRVLYSAHSMLQGQEYKKDTKTLTFSHFKNWFFQTKFRWIWLRLHKNRIQNEKREIFHLQSKCFFFGPIISSVVALHTDLAKPCPAKLCRAANNLSFIVCPAIFFSFSQIFGSITLYFSFTYTIHNFYIAFFNTGSRTPIATKSLYLHGKKIYFAQFIDRLYRFDGTEKFDFVTVDKSPFATEYSHTNKKNAYKVVAFSSCSVYLCVNDRFWFEKVLDEGPFINCVSNEERDLSFVSLS